MYVIRPKLKKKCVKKLPKKRVPDIKNSISGCYLRSLAHEVATGK